MNNKYYLFIAACKGAALLGEFIYLHGRGEFLVLAVRTITVNAQEIKQVS